MTFNLRKLCSSAEEYEANASGLLDLDMLASRLLGRHSVEISRSGPILTILFEDEGVVVRLSSSGKAIIQASMRNDAERVCSILTEAYKNCIKKPILR